MEASSSVSASGRRVMMLTYLGAQRIAVNERNYVAGKIALRISTAYDCFGLGLPRAVGRDVDS